MGSLKIVPFNQYQTTGADYMKNLLAQGVPDVPVQEIADLTPIQQQIQQSLGGALADTTASTKLARDELTNTLAGQYDPRTSDYYKGLREEAEWLQNQGITEIRQRGNLGGMMLSTPTAAVEQSLIRESNSNLLKQLGELYERERDRRSQAARDIQQVESAGLSNLAAVGGLSEMQRSVEQARNDALYNAAMQQVLLPYTQMANVATSLYGMKNDYYIKGQKKSSGAGIGAAIGAVAGVALAPATGGASLALLKSAALGAAIGGGIGGGF